MPTQIPSGSALAVSRPQRRRRAAGPRRLGYAEGGQVGDFKNWERKLDGRMPDPPLEPKPDKQGSPDVLGRAKELAGFMMKGVSGGAGGPAGGAAGGGDAGGVATDVPVEEIPIGSYAKGGMVKKKKFTGPRRLKYAEGGLVLKKADRLENPPRDSGDDAIIKGPRDEHSRKEPIRT